MTHPNYLFALPERTVLSVEGARAAEFLQGQLTCDLRAVDEKTMRQGALCNLKGRVLALLHVLKWQGYQLVLPDSLRLETSQAMEKAALLSRVRLLPTEEYAVFGFQLNDHKGLRPFARNCPKLPYALIANEQGAVYHLGDHFYQILVPKATAHTLAEPFAQNDCLLDNNAWHERQLARGRVDIYPETRGLFLAHNLNLQHTDHISFDKGCYKGQEIVARMHYLGKLKHELQSYVIPKPQKLRLGMPVFDAEHQRAIGEVVDFCLLPEGMVQVMLSLHKERSDNVIFEGDECPTSLR